jgi:hypothetical protein
LMAVFAALAAPVKSRRQRSRMRQSRRRSEVLPAD